VRYKEKKQAVEHIAFALDWKTSLFILQSLIWPSFLGNQPKF
jgi:hypothetical protein